MQETISVESRVAMSLERLDSYYLLSDVVHVANLILMKSIANFNKKAYVVLPFLCGKTTVVLEILYARMLAEVVKVIEVFIGFVHIFDEEHAHNMLDS